MCMYGKKGEGDEVTVEKGIEVRKKDSDLLSARW